MANYKSIKELEIATLKENDVLFFTDSISYKVKANIFEQITGEYIGAYLGINIKKLAHNIWGYINSVSAPMPVYDYNNFEMAKKLAIVIFELVENKNN